MDVLIALKGLPGVLEIDCILEFISSDGKKELKAIVEYYNCGNMREFLHKMGVNLSLLDKYHIVYDLLEGLVSISKARLYIRDSKLENILIKKGKRLKAAFCDFDTGKICDSDEQIRSSVFLKYTLMSIKDSFYKNKITPKEHQFFDSAIQMSQELGFTQEVAQKILSDWEKQFGENIV